MRKMLSLVAALALPATTNAHPHVFVQADVTVVFDGAGGVSVDLVWRYDDLFSLLVTSDLGLDMDGDLVLTAEEQTVLDEQITAWPPEYTGDLEVSQNTVVLPLGQKTDHAMTYENGLFVETHRRPVAATLEPDLPLLIRVFDPSFYTAYDLGAPVKVQGRDDCTVTIFRADIDAAYALAADLLDGQDPNAVGPDEYFPEIGDAFADTIEVTCAGPL